MYTARSQRAKRKRWAFIIIRPANRSGWLISVSNQAVLSRIEGFMPGFMLLSNMFDGALPMPVTEER